MSKSMEKLQGMLCYVQVDKAVPCYEKDKGTEWKCDIIVTDEDVADEFTAIYKKQPPKKIKTTEFEKLYKCAPPEDAGKNVWAITLKRNTKLKNGNEVPEMYQPKVLHQTVNEKGVVTRTDITNSKLVANGSMGSVSIDTWDSPQYGPSARLKNILVKELIEYTRTAQEPGSEFDDEKAPEPPESFNKEKATTKAKKKVEEDVDDPF